MQNEIIEQLVDLHADVNSKEAYREALISLCNLVRAEYSLAVAMDMCQAGQASEVKYPLQ